MPDPDFWETAAGKDVMRLMQQNYFDIVQALRIMSSFYTQEEDHTRSEELWELAEELYQKKASGKVVIIAE